VIVEPVTGTTPLRLTSLERLYCDAPTHFHGLGIQRGTPRRNRAGISGDQFGLLYGIGRARAASSISSPERNARLAREPLRVFPERYARRYQPAAGKRGTRPAANQFGAAIGGPIQKDKTFLYANYEAQRRGESPFYNSAVLTNITSINNFKTSFNLPVEPNLGSVLRTNDTDNGFIRLDRSIGTNQNLFVRYFVNEWPPAEPVAAQ